ncbi:hypothetical protein VIGAN_08267000 [Vigna angularis var. angularis]|uniref:Uncharacterized protein n=1 Tax=Vigna angularis var. angularis TaxID=157739 RepID=A0A0S3SSQ9_PHAAN|nr:hypothetical protein VIGAN_08267000 [Vigna angularis var. angularis]
METELFTLPGSNFKHPTERRRRRGMAAAYILGAGEESSRTTTLERMEETVLAGHVKFTAEWRMVQLLTPSKHVKEGVEKGAHGWNGIEEEDKINWEGPHRLFSRPRSSANARN